jgi:hypothetical protein
MKSQRLSSQRQRLDWLFAQASAFDSKELEMQAHWARYLCILAAGFLENALAEIYSEYAKSCARPTVATYVELALSRVQTPKASRFVETARAFDPRWVDDLEDFLATGGRKDAIDAIMSNRHLLAHGKDSGISLVRVRDYLNKSVEVIEFIEGQCALA